MTFVNYKGTHIGARKVSDVFNVYIKKGSNPVIKKEIFTSQGSKVYVLRIHPSATTQVNLDFAGNTPKHVVALRNEWMINNGWIHIAGINGGYFESDNVTNYGQPTGAILENWSAKWSLWKGLECYPCKGKGYPTIYTDGYSLQYMDGWASDFATSLGHMLWARGVGQSLTIDGKVDCSAGIENGCYNTAECVSMIGMDKDGNWIFAINTIKGLNHAARAKIMLQIGAVISFDLDGGGSAQLWWDEDYIGKTPSGGAAEDIPAQESVKTMRGIDISNYQRGLDLSAVDYDFVICKSTEGIGFVDSTCDPFVQKAEKAGKKIGFYHFGLPSNDPIAEADFWYKNTKNYFGKYLPVLDIEKKTSNVVDWCRQFLTRIIELTGVKPVVYMSEQSFEWAYEWKPVVDLGCGLWIAKYRDSIADQNYDMANAGNRPVAKHWPFYCMWQWTSSGLLDGWSGKLDCDVFYGDEKVWNKYAGIKQIEETNPAEDTNTGTEQKPNEGSNDAIDNDSQNGSGTNRDAVGIMKQIYELLKSYFDK